MIRCLPMGEFAQLPHILEMVILYADGNYQVVHADECPACEKNWPMPDINLLILGSTN